jgi:D-sedoheptulose 7-phosphate isomerase
MNREIRRQIEASIAVHQALLDDQGLIVQLEKLANTCVGAIDGGGKIIFAGNGGSFADAQHLSAEFTSRFLFDRGPLPSLALGTNSSAISAIGNDYGYDHVFGRELRAIGAGADVFIPITTSGNSPNIIAAVDVAKELDIHTVGLTGQSGGQLAARAACIRMPSAETARVQECHILVGHILCGLVEAKCCRVSDPGVSSHSHA